MKHGYWEITIRPDEYPQELVSFDHLRNLLQTCQVQYRGWYYPHISDNDMHGHCHNEDNYVQSQVQYAYFAEIFRFYTSGQFVHYAGMYEDRKNYNNTTSLTRPENSSMVIHKPKQPFLEPVGSLYRLTEILLFASRLAKKDIFGKSIHIAIKLHNQEGRILKSEDSVQPRWWSGISHTNVINLLDTSIDARQLALDYDKMAVDTAIKLLEFFNCTSRDLRTLLESDQKRMYERIV